MEGATMMPARGLRRDQPGAPKYVNTCCSLLDFAANFGSQAVKKANNYERSFIATFFYRNNKTLKLIDQFGAVLATTLFVNGMISITAETTDQPIVWTIVIIISGIAIANVISNSIGARLCTVAAFCSSYWPPVPSVGLPTASTPQHLGRRTGDRD